jgi:hypothetical protein
MKITSISKAAIALGVNALVLGGLVAGPASADPAAGVYADLVGTGSDTTQDVMNGISAALGVNPDSDNLYLGSYDASVGTAADCKTAGDKITPVEGGATFFRPNGSSHGRDTLRAAIGQATSATVKSFACSLVQSDAVGAGSASPENIALRANQTLNATDVRGAVHYARSSSAPSAADTTAVGTIAYVPFAKDAVTVAVSPNSEIPALTFGRSAVNTSVGDVTGKVESTLYAIYTCKATKVVNPATGPNFLANSDYVAVTTPGSADVVTDLKAYIPQSGSGTRSFWIGKFGVVESDIANPGTSKGNCLKDVIVGGDDAGDGVQEHNGTAVGNDNFAITPFSIPQFVAQSNEAPGVTSRINGAVLMAVGGVNPTVTVGSALKTNPAFTTSSASSMLGRLVYNIVPTRELDNPESLTHEVFSGRTSKVCTATAAIEQYGFALLTARTGASSCGDTSLRAYAPSTTSMTVEVVDAAASTGVTVTSAVAGDTVHFRLKNLVTNGNGGGTVELSDGRGNVFAQIDVDEGSSNPVTGTNTTWLYESVTLDDSLPGGQYDVVATFIPDLPGVATSSAPNLISFTIDARDIDGFEYSTFPRTYKVGSRGKLEVMVEGTGVTPTGTVTVKIGSKVVGRADLSEYNQGGAGGNIAQRGMGKAVVTLAKFKRKGNTNLTIEYSGDDTFNSSTDTLAIRVR